MGGGQQPRVGFNSADYPELSDGVLISLLRNDDPGAFREFVRRFSLTVTRQGRRHGIPESERKHWTLEVLDDLMMDLIRPSRALPHSLPAFVAGTARNRALADLRANGRRDAALARAHDSPSDSGEDAVPSLQSEYSLRAARAEEGDQIDANAVIRLGKTFAAMLTTAELEMFVWTNEGVPLRLVAKWHGCERSTAAQRLWRLRAKLLLKAPHLLSEFSVSERRVLTRFFRRVIADPDSRELGAKIRASLEQLPPDGEPND